MFTALRRTVSLLIAALGVLSLAEPIRAQSQTQAQASQPTLEEVVVTARKREEPLLSVPVTMSVFTNRRSSQRALKRRAISSRWFRT